MMTPNRFSKIVITLSMCSVMVLFAYTPGEGATLFYEDFSDGVANGITLHHPEAMSIGPGPFGSGNALFAANLNSTGRNAIFSLDGIPSDDVSIELDFSIATGAYGDLDIWFNAPITSTGITRSGPDSGYTVRIHPAGSDNPVADINRYDNAIRSVLNSTPNTIAANTPHTLKVVRFGSSIQAYLDNVQILSANDGIYSGNSIAFRFHGGGAVDNIRVTSLSTPINVIQIVEEVATALLKRIDCRTNEDKDRFIVFDGQGGWAPGGSINNSKPTIVLSHGYNSNYYDDDAWTKKIADTLTLRGVDANIVAWDWEDDASPIGDHIPGTIPALVDLPIAGLCAISHGKVLGQWLLNELGLDYDKKIHFIGHSLGTRVNKEAADLLHENLPDNDGFKPENTHVTIFDAAEFIVEKHLPWSDPIPDAKVAYIDNYISAFGDLHEEAVNIQLFAEIPSILRPDLYATEFHSLPAVRYEESIGNITIPVGYRWSFEEGTLDGSEPQPNTHFIQTAEGLVFESQTSFEANFNMLQRNVGFVYGLVLAPIGLQVQAVRAVGDVTAGIAQAFVDGVLVETFTLSLFSSSPAYAWATIEIPSDAEYVSFDLLFEGFDEDDFFAFGIDDTLLLSLDLSHIDNESLTNVGLLDVSQWAGTTVDVFYGLETAEAGRTASIENFMFLNVVPEPSSLMLLVLGAVALAAAGRRRR